MPVDIVRTMRIQMKLTSSMAIQKKKQYQAQRRRVSDIQHLQVKDVICFIIILTKSQYKNESFWIKKQNAPPSLARGARSRACGEGVSRRSRRRCSAAEAEKHHRDEREPRRGIPHPPARERGRTQSGTDQGTHHEPPWWYP